MSLKPAWDTWDLVLKKKKRQSCWWKITNHRVFSSMNPLTRNTQSVKQIYPEVFVHWVHSTVLSVWVLWCCLLKAECGRKPFPSLPSPPPTPSVYFMMWREGQLIKDPTFVIFLVYVFWNVLRWIFPGKDSYMLSTLRKYLLRVVSSRGMCRV